MMMKVIIQLTYKGSWMISYLFPFVCLFFVSKGFLELLFGGFVVNDRTQDFDALMDFKKSVHEVYREEDISEEDQNYYDLDRFEVLMEDVVFILVQKDREDESL